VIKTRIVGNWNTTAQRANQVSGNVEEGRCISQPTGVDAVDVGPAEVGCRWVDKGCPLPRLSTLAIDSDYGYFDDPPSRGIQTGRFYIKAGEDGFTHISTAFDWDAPA
jgi:hypothetical protein